LKPALVDSVSAPDIGDLLLALSVTIKPDRPGLDVPCPLMHRFSAIRQPIDAAPERFLCGIIAKTHSAHNCPK
jgi:hypothetical protein